MRFHTKHHFLPAIIALATLAVGSKAQYGHSDSQMVEPAQISAKQHAFGGEMRKL